MFLKKNKLCKKLNKIINYFVKEVNTVNAIFIIRCISILLICSQGLMLSLVYGRNLNLFCSLFKNCNKKKEPKLRDRSESFDEVFSNDYNKQPDDEYGYN